MGSAYTVVDHLQTGGPYTEVSHGFSLYSGGPPTDRWSLYRGDPWGVVDHLQTGGPYTEVTHGFSLYSGGPPTDRWSLYRGDPWVQPIQWWTTYRQVVLIQR